MYLIIIIDHAHYVAVLSHSGIGVATTRALEEGIFLK